MRALREATVGELAALVNARVIGDESQPIGGIATLLNAQDNEISFLHNPKYHKQLASTHAAAVLVSQQFAQECPSIAIVCDNPYLAYAVIAEYLFSEGEFRSGIHASASIADDAQISELARIDENVVISSGVVISPGVHIGAGSFIGKDSSIGADTRIFPNVTVYARVEIGSDCMLHSGCVIGADGFGIAKDGERWVRIPQIGGVKIGNRVDVGANTTIDSGALEPTTIEDGVKIDDQIHIAHNCRIGENTAIAAETGISGSTTIGKNCTIGGGSGFNGHITICDDVHFTGMSMVTKSIDKPGVYSSGMPVQENAAWRKNAVRLRQVEKLEQKVKKLAAQIAKLDVED